MTFVKKAVPADPVVTLTGASTTDESADYALAVSIDLGGGAAFDAVRSERVDGLGISGLDLISMSERNGISYFGYAAADPLI